MLFRAENLGPLKTAEVDLSKDLIVLTGPNNSGKTYLAWSVYGLFRSRREPKIETHPQWFADALLQSDKPRVNFAVITPYWQEVLSGVARVYVSAQGLRRCFAAESGYFEGTKLSIQIGDAEALTKKIESGQGPLFSGKTLQWFCRLDSVQGTIALNVASQGARVPMGDESRDERLLGLRDDWDGAPASWRSVPEEERLHIAHLAAYGLARRMAYTAFSRCVLFPAERIAVNIFAKELELNRFDLVDKIADEEFGDARVAEEVRQRAGRYPWPIRDSIRVANDLSHVSKEKTQFADLADEMEAALLQGKIGVSEYGEMIFTPNAAPDKRLSVHLTASVIKSLASLVFYFRHMAEANDFLIIDEPELNLHPDNQRKIARILAKAVNRGFKIMMSTHSDYVIRELNNLIMLNQKSEAAAKLIDELGYERACLLDPERVGVYLFNEHHSEAVSVTETGFEVKTIENEINQLNLVSQRIYGTLFD